MTLRTRAIGAAISAIASPRMAVISARARAFFRRLRGKPPAIELYAQVDDPQTFLVAQLLPELRARYGVEVEVIPVSPAPLPAGAEPPADVRFRYAVRDARQLSRYYEVDFPAGPDAPDPELVRRASAVLTGADRRDVEAVIDIGRAVWSGDELAIARLEAALGAAGRDDMDRRLARGRARLSRRGHYAGGAMRLDGLWAVGVDRLRYIEELLGSVEPILSRRDATMPVEPWRATATQLDLYYSFRSPYSYLALGRTFALADAYGIELEVKPILPSAMRGIRVPLAKRLYLVRDARREADRLGIPFGRVCDPIGAGVERCQALFPWATQQGRARQFLLSIGRGIWSEARDVSDDRDLARLVGRAGLDWEQARRHLSDDSWRASVERNLRELHQLGLWGVPTFRLGDVAAWGQDRLWVIEDALHRAHGPMPISASAAGSSSGSTRS